MYWKHMNIFSTYSTQQRRGGNTGNNNVLGFFVCHAWVSNTSVTQINNREEDDKALLYLEQLSWSHRAAAGAAGLCRSVTVDGTTSLLPSSTPLLWSPTGVPFIAYSAAEGWWGCVRVCLPCACKKEKMREGLPFLKHGIVSLFCFKFVFLKSTCMLEGRWA